MRSTAANKDTNRKLVGQVGDLAHGESKKFTLRSGELNFEAMLVNYGGNYFAYVNRCPHVGISLDWVDNQFFTVDRRYLICANHGATFEPASGECIWGPCIGTSLRGVPLEIDGRRIFVRWPVPENEDQF
jgi:nitrite reductase/ring-hydroxylating ferredoxin subunit